MRLRRTVLYVTLALALGPRPVVLPGAEMPDPIAYTLRFPAPQTHYLEVEARVPTAGKDQVELMMAVWTPGSYMVREYARNVEGLTARGGDGEPLAVEKVAKNRWRVAAGGRDPVFLTYRLYAREMSVRTNFVDAGFALLNGAATFLTLAESAESAESADPAGSPPRPHEVRLVLPAAWRTAITPLPALPGAANAYRAEDFHTLVDSPIYAGNPQVREFQAEGKRHLLVNGGEMSGEGSAWDGARTAADLERLVGEVTAFWGTAPYPRYTFFNLITEESGGLEHRDSTVLMTSRWKSRTREGRLDWLSLAAHEMFHAWNVKRLRPVELDRFDYERENYTRSLWIVEGLTSYYDDLLVVRAGLASREEYFKRLGKQIDALQTAPGRLVQPLADASFDAWIKYYRRDENFVNSGISYYTKGAVVGFLLDARIRQATGGAQTLDDAMRLAYRRYSGERGYREEEFRRVLEEVGGTEVRGWLSRVLDTTEELDYADAMAWLGLRFTLDKSDEEKNGDAREEPAGWLGVETEVRDGRLVVTEVRRGTPGEAAGVSVDDEILALGDYRVIPAAWKDRLKAYRPGEKAILLVARRELLTRLPVTFGEKPLRRWKVEVDPQATPEQRSHLAAWLGGRSEPAAPATSGAAMGRSASR